MRRKVTVTLTAMSGSELWVRVAYGSRSFKVPADVPLSTILQGVEEQWTSAPKRQRGAPAHVRVSWGRWRELCVLEEAMLAETGGTPKNLR